MYRNNSADLASEQVTVRQARDSDRVALATLASLDSAEAPHGPALVAESGARILAALPLGSGRPIADPFEPTAAMVALLELRRSQLERGAHSPKRSVSARARELFSFATPQRRISS
jgi:hypothetical protein